MENQRTNISMLRRYIHPQPLGENLAGDLPTPRSVWSISRGWLREIVGEVRSRSGIGIDSIVGNGYIEDYLRISPSPLPRFSAPSDRPGGRVWRGGLPLSPTAPLRADVPNHLPMMLAAPTIMEMFVLSPFLER